MIDILRLAASGARVRQIADHLGVSQEEAADRLAAAVRQAATLNVDQEGAREIELTHLDMLRASLTPAALKGDIAAARILVRIHQARAIMLGLQTVIEIPEPEGVDDLERIRADRERRRSGSA